MTQQDFSSEQLLQHWQQVKQQVATASAAVDREPVTLLAVSKTKPAEMVATLAKAGQSHFGENYLQEAVDKIEAVKDLVADQVDTDIVWHYIGHIQRNKTRDIAQTFDWVHTIERDIIAKRLNNQRPEGLPKLNVLIQVNIDQEESKSGCLPEALDELVNTVKGYDNLCLRGLMIIPSKEGTDAFERTKQLFDEMKQAHPELTHWDTLSMGMSADMTHAIAQGSTMVRVGSAIFGARD
ncbi:YggS family pyridoxal phosphate-dependent enzyme [Psychrobacter sp. FDAARGOS_221]|uniref:YggS family pyridoxal phosphate-dependent enzyme n=1 Tax=Psychrobacter sp. FDAARGOS_221 TaxID=1975705 RepID=UPI000BB531DE|nr:YggS family pyridoxal phosphate-dependent enzyme [Psychrobacter sp. FDAARGOS_221]PNK61278.1 YggS family pyridoxal phosphate-dependent enzyme [Psychrobacter sp. FDAARGOS_221]